MGTHLDTINNYQLIEQIKNVKIQMKNASDISSDPELFETNEWFTQVLNHLEMLYKSTDRNLISTSTIANIINQLTPINVNFQNYIQTKNFNYILGSTANIEAIITYLPQFLYPKTRKELTGLVDAIASSRTSIEKINKQIDERQQQLIAVNLELEKGLQSLAASVEVEKESVSNNFVTLRKESIDNTKIIIKEMEDSIAIEGTKFIDYYKLNIDDLNFKMKSDLETIEQYKLDAKKLLGIISVDTMSNGFGKVALEEKLSKQKWNKLVLGGSGAFVVFAGVFGFSHFTSNISLPVLISRWFTFLPFVFFIAYSAKQASLHWKSERYNRKMELELASIGPYLAAFDLKEQLDIKKILADKFFGKEEATNVKNDEIKIPYDDLLKLLVQTTEQITKFKKGT